jgi:hypothetical protein
MKVEIFEDIQDQLDCGIRQRFLFDPPDTEALEAKLRNTMKDCLVMDGSSRTTALASLEHLARLLRIASEPA